MRSLSKQNSDQSNKDSAIYIGMFIIVSKFILFNTVLKTEYSLGTTKNCILEGSAIKKTFKIAVWGHSGKLEGIASHPDDLGKNSFTLLQLLSKTYLQNNSILQLLLLLGLTKL